MLFMETQALPALKVLATSSPTLPVTAFVFPRLLSTPRGSFLLRCLCTWRIEAMSACLIRHDSGGIEVNYSCACRQQGAT